MKTKREVLNRLDRAITYIAPRWGARRALARARLHAVRAYFDGATYGRRGASIRRSAADANAITARSLPRLRAGARDLARNNPHARRAVEAIVSNVIGTGVSPQFYRGGERDSEIEQLMKHHLQTTACDADGRHDFAGLQAVVMQGVAEGGEMLIRRRWRRSSDGLPVPVQFQVLEPEYLDESRDGPTASGGQIVQGVEFDAIGRRRAYWLYREHPGSQRGFGSQSDRVPARDITHVYRVERAGQVRGLPWAAPVMLTLADFSDYQDAQLVRQKMAACYVAFVKESFDGGVPNFGAEVGDDGELIDGFEPGMIERLPPGTEVEFGNPPKVEGYAEYTREMLRTIAVGFGISYEALTSDLRNVNFSSGRMGHLEFQRNIDRWRSQIVIPQLCDPLMRWWLEALELVQVQTEGVTVRYVAPRREMIDPAKEGRADRDAIRAGQKTLSQVIRASGRDPIEHLTELAGDFALLDELGLTLDSDPRRTGSQGGIPGSHAGDESDDDQEEAA